MQKLLEKTLDCLSGQWIVDCFGSNGGHVVVLRALVVGVELTSICLIVQALIDPSRHGPMSLVGLASQLADLGSVIGAIFAGAYAAFYTRFVSQWTYLAGVYNLIKQAESAKDCKQEIINQWKAGYVEDAENLHLMLKPGIAPIVKAWAEDTGVQIAYEVYTPGGAVRLSGVKASVSKVFHKEELKYLN